ncbi:MAG: hypothetical protein Q9178_007177 [Gyalolechia marmorata]
MAREQMPARISTNAIAGPSTDPLEQFRYLVEHRGQEVVDYILTLRQYNDDALDLNEELTGLVTRYEELQASYDTQQEELETVKADLVGSRDRAKKLKEELAAAKRELAATKGQL